MHKYKAKEIANNLAHSKIAKQSKTQLTKSSGKTNHKINLLRKLKKYKDTKFYLRPTSSYHLSPQESSLDWIISTKNLHIMENWNKKKKSHQDSLFLSLSSLRPKQQLKIKTATIT